MAIDIQLNDLVAIIGTEKARKTFYAMAVPIAESSTNEA